jgi:hypothetical protein
MTSTADDRLLVVNGLLLVPAVIYSFLFFLSTGIFRIAGEVESSRLHCVFAGTYGFRTDCLFMALRTAGLFAGRYIPAGYPQ